MPKKIVVVGGGTGTYVTLTGLKKYPYDLTAIVGVTDSGGSSGVLRDELGVLPPGDIRRALLALSDLPLEKDNLRQLLSYRFDNGTGLRGHSLGNLLISALTQINGRLDLAIKDAQIMFDVQGTVLPISLTSAELCARLQDGTIIKGETNIDIRRVRPDLKILDIFLDRPAKILPEAKKAIGQADLIVLSPGDLYTSLLPNFLFDGFNRAINKSKAKLVYVCNLMTKFGETDGYKVSDFVREAKRYLGPAGKKLRTVLVNNNLQNIPPKILRRYKQEKAYPVQIDEQECKKLGVELVVRKFAITGQLFRHDSEVLAKEIVKMISGKV